VLPGNRERARSSHSQTDRCASNLPAPRTTTRGDVGDNSSYRASAGVTAATSRVGGLYHAVGGERRERIIHTRKTRRAALAIHALIATSLFALPLLQMFPMAVRYGLFLYVGIVSLSGNQFVERWLL